MKTLNILCQAEARQRMVGARLIQANAKRVLVDYKVGDWVYGWTDPKKELKPIYTGPRAIEKVQTNGTVTICRGPIVWNRVNTRQTKPSKN
eukprot:scaffold31792_cov168-Amphora_coffeaeformis.AAC.6